MRAQHLVHHYSPNYAACRTLGRGMSAFRWLRRIPSVQVSDVGSFLNCISHQLGSSRPERVLADRTFQCDAQQGGRFVCLERPGCGVLNMTDTYEGEQDLAERGPMHHASSSLLSSKAARCSHERKGAARHLRSTADWALPKVSS